MMLGMLLESVRGAQHGRFVERFADNLQADRQSIRESARNADRRNARQADRNRQISFKYIVSGSPICSPI